jgi:hypothetical protein
MVGPPTNPDGTPLTTTTTPAAQLFPAGTVGAQVPMANAFINLGAGPFKDANTIASGSPDAWFNSHNSQVLNLFGGTPTPQQQADFAGAVLQRVQQTFQLSGVPVTLTSDPNTPAAHTLGLVSNATAQSLPSAIGMSYLGGNGLSSTSRRRPPPRSTSSNGSPRITSRTS